LALSTRSSYGYGDPRHVYSFPTRRSSDLFKAFNDCHGHPAGDRILQIVARILRANAGAEGFVARTGGEEFAFVVEGLSEDAAARSEEHTSELQSRENLVCRLLLEKKKQKN